MILPGGLVTSFGDTVTETVLAGSMLLAVPLAALAGLVSFASPCVLPLVPGYLGFVGGLAGSGAAVQAGSRPRLRLVLGVGLFIAGFTAVFVTLGVLAGTAGAVLVRYADPVTRVLGALVALLGLSFAGWLPLGTRERRFHVAPRAGLWGAPLLGLAFGLGWAPCIGPTLVAVYTLALDEASAGRGALLSVAYCAGLGLPFVLVALGVERSARVMAWLRTHRVAVMRAGGLLLVALGLALVTGLWSWVTDLLGGWAAGVTVVV